MGIVLMVFFVMTAGGYSNIRFSRINCLKNFCVRNVGKER